MTPDLGGGMARRGRPWALRRAAFAFALLLCAAALSSSRARACQVVEADPESVSQFDGPCVQFSNGNLRQHLAELMLHALDPKDPPRAAHLYIQDHEVLQQRLERGESSLLKFMLPVERGVTLRVELDRPVTGTLKIDGSDCNVTSCRACLDRPHCGWSTRDMWRGCWEGDTEKPFWAVADAVEDWRFQGLCPGELPHTEYWFLAGTIVVSLAALAILAVFAVHLYRYIRAQMKHRGYMRVGDDPEPLLKIDSDFLYDDLGDDEF